VLTDLGLAGSDGQAIPNGVATRVVRIHFAASIATSRYAAAGACAPPRRPKISAAITMVSPVPMERGLMDVALS
jgi:hypothetical protein